MFVDVLFLCVLPDSIVHVNELLRQSVSGCFESVCWCLLMFVDVC